MQGTIFNFPTSCAFRVVGNFGDELVEDDYEGNITKEDILSETDDYTGVFVSSFNLSDNKQMKAFKKLSKWFDLRFRMDVRNDSTDNIITLVVFDTKNLLVEKE